MKHKLEDLAAQLATQWAHNRVVPSNAPAGLVYSTQAGRMCPHCAQPKMQCACKANAAKAMIVASEGVVRVSRETKGRGGKAVTLIKGLPLQAEDLTAMGKTLKTACGTGGTVKDSVIEIQGDHVERIVQTLKEQGFQAKRAGG